MKSLASAAAVPWRTRLPRALRAGLGALPGLLAGVALYVPLLALALMVPAALALYQARLQAAAARVR